MTECYIVVSKVKKMVKEKGLRTGGEYLEALSKKVVEIINGSVQKVQSEGKKKTLGSDDI